MFELDNQTPFEAALMPGMDKDDVANLTVIVKSTWGWTVPAHDLVPADRQLPIIWTDTWNGPDAAKSSVRMESDASPVKPGTDVILIGHAYTPGASTQVMDVSLGVGALRKAVRVFGERAWTRAAGSWVASPPVPFETMPLVYERAFGGIDTSDPKQERHGGDDRNPVGRGFVLRERSERLEGLLLPNLEDPRAPLRAWKDRPPVAGFGFVSRGWLPRRSFAGTYDDSWQANRAPLLPEDFDARFFNGAPLDQVVYPHLQGGEPVRVVGASGTGELTFRLPRWAFEVHLQIGNAAQHATPVMDTVVIEPDDWRATITWRCTVRCGRRMLQVRKVTVRGAAA